MEVVFIVGAVQALFLTVLVINKKEKFSGDFLLVALLLLMGFMLLGYTMEVKGADVDYPIFLSFYTTLPVLVGPLLYLYALVYTRQSDRINTLFFLHTLPYMIFTIGVLLQFFVYSEGSVAEDILLIEDGDHPMFVALELWRIFGAPVYLLVSLQLLRKHRNRVEVHFSYTEEIDLKWLRYVIWIMLLLYMVVVIINILSNFNSVFDYRIGDNIIYATITVIVFLIGYYGLKQQVIFSPAAFSNSNIQSGENPDILKPKRKYAHSGLSDHKAQRLVDALRKHMEEEQPFLNGKLTLNDVASHLGVSTNHLSQVINENLNKNFFDFINQYRIELVKQKMMDPTQSHLTILGMAYDSGFNSKSGFNDVFKKFTGCTPSQYRDKMKEA